MLLDSVAKIKKWNVKKKKVECRNMKEVRKLRRCNRATVSSDIMSLQQNLLGFHTLRGE